MTLEDARREHEQTTLAEARRLVADNPFNHIPWPIPDQVRLVGEWPDTRLETEITLRSGRVAKVDSLVWAESHDPRLNSPSQRAGDLMTTVMEVWSTRF